MGEKLVDGERRDFDALYTEMIRPAAVAAGWDVARIDETISIGSIEDALLQELINADLVLAEVSTPNANVFYELGLRHALAPGGALLIASTGTELPFDIATQRVVFYPDQDAGRASIERALREFGGTSRSPNLVRESLERAGALASPTEDPVAFERETAGRVDRAQTEEQLIAAWLWLRLQAPLPISPLITLASRLAEHGSWPAAIEVLEHLVELRPDDYEIRRQLGWYLRNRGDEFEVQALEQLHIAQSLNPNDPETLGMIGGINKRRGDYATALSYYERAWEIAPGSIYILVNLAALAILSDPTQPEAGVARYEELLALAAEQDTPPDEWAELVAGEAAFAKGDDDAATRHFDSALALASSRRSIESAASQLDLFASAGYRSDSAASLASRLRTKNAPVGRFQSGHLAGPVLLHISDLHLCDEDGPALHRFDSDPSGLSMAEHLLAEFSEAGAFTIDQARLHLVVTGDITWKASDAEFRLARVQLEKLTEGLGIERRRVHIVPGNHDVNWTLAKDDQTRRFDNYLRFLGEFYGDDLMRERFADVPWPQTLNDERPTPDCFVGLYVDRDSGVLIATLNSCVYENEQHHYGYVGQPQLRRLRDQIAQYASDDLVRVVALHHHMHPFPEYLQTPPSDEVWTDVSTVRDAGSVERMLEQLGFDVVLHGHKHRAQARETLLRDPGPLKADPRRLLVFGAGSVSCIELEHAEPNQYEVLDFLRVPRREDVPFVRVEWRTLQLSAGAEWITEQSWEVSG